MDTNRMLRSSQTPLDDIRALTYPGQPENRHRYRTGYEPFMDAMQYVTAKDPLFKEKYQHNISMMKALASLLSYQDWIKMPPQNSDNFERIILALERPEYSSVDGSDERSYVTKAGNEIVVGKWENNRGTPIHGHARGFSFEYLLYGDLLATTYRQTSEGKVRPVKMKKLKAGDQISEGFTEPETTREYVNRDSNIHSIQALGYAATLHYFGEHNRDARDNTFEAEYFEQSIGAIELMSHLQRISTMDAMYLRPGDVVLAKSKTVDYLGTYFAVVTGPADHTDHGFRVQTEIIPAPHDMIMPTHFQEEDVVLLKLDKAMKSYFYEFHEICMEQGKKVLFAR